MTSSRRSPLSKQKKDSYQGFGSPCPHHRMKYKKSHKRAIAKRILSSLGVGEEVTELVVENHGLKGLICALRQELASKSSSEGDSLDLVHGFPKAYGGTVIVTRTTEILIGNQRSRLED
ncbi:hypothetical protein G4B88_014453 [Cannabis sativa]|uniref:Uncharacterized protein n=1 Tax=Cannabis sativa TaxID=3483 RepID=A0A7J6I8Z4_CANSA|nr:hypothetical protein G4B88_014453 [Cannabis sativa]